MKIALWRQQRASVVSQGLSTAAATGFAAIDCSAILTAVNYADFAP
jgi:hypothetical protein